MLNNVARATTCDLLLAVPSPEVSLSVSGSLYARNKVTISCNIHVAASVVSEVRVVAVWKMESVQLTNSSRIVLQRACRDITYDELPLKNGHRTTDTCSVQEYMHMHLDLERTIETLTFTVRPLLGSGLLYTQACEQT